MNARRSILLGACALLPLGCREEPKSTRKPPPPQTEKKEQDNKSKKSLLSVPAGAVISNLTLPYRNESNRKISLVTIEELTVNEGEQTDEVILFANNLKLWLFDRKEAIRSTTTISSATYRVEKEILEARGEILMVGSQNTFAAKSAGGIFSLATGQAFLRGPAITRFESLEKK